MNIHPINENHEHCTLVYFATCQKDILILSKIEKSKECKWFTNRELNKLNKDISKTIKLYAKAALETLTDY